MQKNKYFNENLWAIDVDEDKESGRGGRRKAENQQLQQEGGNRVQWNRLLEQTRPHERL